MPAAAATSQPNEGAIQPADQDHRLLGGNSVSGGRPQASSQAVAGVEAGGKASPAGIAHLAQLLSPQQHGCLLAEAGPAAAAAAASPVAEVATAAEAAVEAVEGGQQADKRTKVFVALDFEQCGGGNAAAAATSPQAMASPSKVCPPKLHVLRVLRFRIQGQTIISLQQLREVSVGVAASPAYCC